VRIVVGEEAVEDLEHFERVGAGGDPAAVGHIHEALGGGPGVEDAIEGAARGGDFGLGARLLGTDDDESGISGPPVWD
jgi:hypothetical protein